MQDENSIEFAHFWLMDLADDKRQQLLQMELVALRVPPNITSLAWRVFCLSYAVCFPHCTVVLSPQRGPQRGAQLFSPAFGI